MKPFHARGRYLTIPLLNFSPELCGACALTLPDGVNSVCQMDEHTPLFIVCSNPAVDNGMRAKNRIPALASVSVAPGRPPRNGSSAAD